MDSKKLGVMVNDLGASQLNYFMIKKANDFLKERSGDFEFIVFYEDAVRPCMQTNFATMQSIEAFSYNGSIVCTNLRSAEKLLKLPGPQKKIFYVWDLEWLRIHPQRRIFAPIANIYRNKYLQLIARGEAHKALIEDCWNRPVSGIVEDFNMVKLSETLAL